MYSSVPALSRNSTLSSTSTRGSSFSFQHSSISRENAIHKPHSVDDPAFLPSKPGSFHNSDLLQKRHRHNIEPDCCFVPCKTVHMNFIPTAQQHFITPIFVMVITAILIKNSMIYLHINKGREAFCKYTVFAIQLS